MTKEEREKAIDALKMSVPFIPITPEEFDNYINTLNQVIDWLDHNPCDDVAAFKEDALDAISRIGLTKCSTKKVKAVYECFEAVKKLQPVTMKPETVTEFADRCRECGKMRTGHWIIMHDGKYSCDRCNRESPNNEKWDYCPICGAEMGNRIDPKIGYKDCFQPKTEHLNIPFLMHKELEIPISECQKAYDVAIDYLRNQANVRG